MVKVLTLGSEFSWFDAGNAESLFQAASAVRAAQRSGKYIGCIEEVALKNNWITVDEMLALSDEMSKTEYGKYLMWCTV